MARIIKLRDYEVSPQDLFLFDNNVWVLLYGAIGSVHQAKQNAYSALFQQILSRKAMIVLSSLIVSEFTNYSLRIAFERWKRSTSSPNAIFKHNFMPTKEYQTAYEGIKATIKSIEKVTEKWPDNFNTISLDNILRIGDNIDFNDSYLANYCIKNNIKLVTDDSDFSKIASDKLTIITL